MISRVYDVPLSPLTLLSSARHAFASNVAVMDGDGTEVTFAELGGDDDAMACAMRAIGVRVALLDSLAGQVLLVSATLATLTATACSRRTMKTR